MAFEVLPCFAILLRMTSDHWARPFLQCLKGWMISLGVFPALLTTMTWAGFWLGSVARVHYCTGYYVLALIYENVNAHHVCRAEIIPVTPERWEGFTSVMSDSACKRSCCVCLLLAKHIPVWGRGSESWGTFVNNIFKEANCWLFLAT